jgi:hypothetical protein
MCIPIIYLFCGYVLLFITRYLLSIVCLFNLLVMYFFIYLFIMYLYYLFLHCYCLSVNYCWNTVLFSNSTHRSRCTQDVQRYDWKKCRARRRPKQIAAVSENASPPNRHGITERGGNPPHPRLSCRSRNRSRVIRNNSPPLAARRSGRPHRATLWPLEALARDRKLPARRLPTGQCCTCRCRSTGKPGQLPA